MNDTTDYSHDSERLLAEFFQRLADHPDSQALLGEYCRLYPQHSEEFHDAVRLRLAPVEPALDDEFPSRLGDFHLLRRIARGGMGDVYEAVQEPLQRRVAVKTIRRGHVSPEAKGRFLREQRVLANLHAAHIVPVFAAGEHDDIQYFAMPYIEGATLGNVLRTARNRRSAEPASRTPTLREIVRQLVGNDDTAGKDKTAPTCPDPSPATPALRQPAGDGDGPLRLSKEYFVSVSQAIAEVADSLDHAHRHGFIHRDVKPSNIMVDLQGRSWMIDFGLARAVEDAALSPASPHIADDCPPVWQTTQAGALGTPGYMSPEQERNQQADVRSDVWALGATLYELLTMQRAYPAALNFRDAAPGAQLPRPPAPRALVPSVPRDLDGICRTCIALEPERRYATAGELADDLRRWMRDEPTRARPAGLPRRFVLLTRRNKALTAAVTAALLCLVALAVSAVVASRARATAAEADSEASKARTQVAEAETRLAKAETQTAQARTRLADAQTQIAKAETESAKAETRAARRTTLALEGHTALIGARQAGWSKQALDKFREAIQIRPDRSLHSNAAGALVGLDLRTTQHLSDCGAATLAFDPPGKRLILGGVWRGRTKLPTRSMDVASSSVKTLSVARDGPIAFRADGAALQLVANADKLILSDAATGQPVVHCPLPREVRLANPESACLAVTPDATRMACQCGGGRPSGATPSPLFVWDAAGQLLWSKPLEVASIGFSPDGALVATGDAEGKVCVFSVSDGKELCSFRGGSTAVQCLAFDRDRRRGPDAKSAGAERGWLLAAGDAGGTVTIWDLTARIPRSYCRGGAFDVYAVAFSPDGATLAAAGRGPVRLYDVATGRLLLAANSGDYITALAFSPDGRLLATGCSPGGPAECSLWEATLGRAGRELRGLTGRVNSAVFSRDGKSVVAIAHNWEIGVWDAETGFLKHVFLTPRGTTADNAAYAVSPDGKQLAFATLGDACLWDLDSGKRLRHWELRPGISDLLAFDGQGRLLSCRAETRDGTRGPFADAPPAQYPRVVRIRNLLAPEPRMPLAEIADFSWHFYGGIAASDGTYFALDGLDGPEGPEKPGSHRRVTRVYDPAGKMLLDIPNKCDWGFSTFAIDRSGRWLAVCKDHNAFPATVYEMPSGQPHGQVLASKPDTLAAAAALWVRRGEQELPPGLWLYARNDLEPRIGLGLDWPVTAAPAAFDSAGRRLVWGSENGAVTICDLAKLSTEMKSLDPAWPGLFDRQ